MRLWLAGLLALAACTPPNAAPTNGVAFIELGDGHGVVRVRPDPRGCGADCVDLWGRGEAVEIDAIPGADSSFDGWEGACVGKETCWVALDRASTVGARFRFDAYEWSREIEGTRGDRDASIALDDRGDALVRVAHALYKFGSKGELLWTLDAAPGATFQAAAVDASGDVSLVGRSREGGAYVARYRSDKRLRWSLEVPGALASIATTADGRVVAAGHFNGTLSFAGHDLKSHGGDDALLVAISAEGKPLWARGAGTTGNDAASALLITGDRAVATARDRIVLGGSLRRDEAGNERAFLRAYGQGGEELWAEETSTEGFVEVRSMTSTRRGEVLVAGRFANTLALRSERLRSAGGTDAFVLALDERDGEPRWSQRYGGPFDDAANAIAISQSGRIAVTGSFAGEVGFGDHPLTSVGGRVDARAAQPAPDAFLIALMGKGLVRSALRLGTSGVDAGHALAADKDDVLWVGRFASIRLKPVAIDGALRFAESEDWPSYRVARLPL